MTMNMRKYDENRDVYVPPEIDTWYQLRFDHDTGYLVIVHHDRSQPLFKNGEENYFEMRRVIMRAMRDSGDSGPSSIYIILDKVLNNYRQLRDNRLLKDYIYVREYRLSKAEKLDLTNLANYLKKTGMPRDFVRHFFHVENGVLIVKTVLTQADINKAKLDIKEMESYVWSRKQLDEIHTFNGGKNAGWYPNGKPPVFTKYKKRQN